MTQKFWVDWHDRSFPEIRPIESCPDPQQRGLTLGRAKMEIRVAAQRDRKHWTQVLKSTNGATIFDVMRNERGRNG